MHSAVSATTGLFSHLLTCGKAAVMTMVISALGLYPEYGVAQSRDDSAAEKNLSGDEPQDDPAPVRRIQRLGDVVGESEWELGLSVPQETGTSPKAPTLPDEHQQKELEALLAQLASTPGDQATLDSLGALLDDVLRQADAAIDANQREQAENLLAVVQAVNPDHPGIKSVQSRIEGLGEVQVHLAAARKAMQEGRIDQPETDCAWFFYRQVLDQDPENEEAQAGLLSVQQDMIARSIGYAETLDFDSAERLLEEAALVNEDQSLVEQARSEIGRIKAQRAAVLEAQAVQEMDSGDFQSAEKTLVNLVALGGQGDVVSQLRRRLEESRIYGGFQPGQVIRDHFVNTATWAPDSVVILAGSYLMGSTTSEPGRADNEGPQHRVTFRQGFAIGQREVSVGEFRKFIKNTGFRTDAERSGRSIVYDAYSGRLTEKEGMNWEMDYEGKAAKENHPVIHVSWDDAEAYLAWLARGTGKSYRLPSEAEFEYALRGGSATLYWWGDGSPSTVVENITGEKDTSRARRSWTVAFVGYGDKFWGPAPVGSFQPNPFGLMDIGGNVGEWVKDCWHDTYVRAPLDGTAWVNPGCEQHVIRGGYWASSPEQTRSAFRLYAKRNHHDARIGFRVARDL